MDPETKYDHTIFNKRGQSIEVDVYDVLEAFKVTNPASQHAIKKLLCAGRRGKGSAVTDVDESIVASQRALDIERVRENANLRPFASVARIDSREGVREWRVRDGKATAIKRR